MSEDRTETRPDPKDHSPQTKGDAVPGAAPSGPAAPSPAAARPLDYVFKVVRADPKNTANFEDVADK